MELELESSTSKFKNDLGTGVANEGYLDCLIIEGMKPYFENDNIKCKLYHGTITQNARILIYNYKDIEADTKVRFSIPCEYPISINYLS